MSHKPLFFKRNIFLLLFIPIFSIAGFSINAKSISGCSIYLYGDTSKRDTAKYTQFKDLPLKPVRKIKYTTTEGSWMSLDVSPDGQTIVFDLMGDLYTMPISGGLAKAITKGLAYDVHIPDLAPTANACYLFLTEVAQITYGISILRKKTPSSSQKTSTKISLTPAGRPMVNT
jgi:hypothetical protein